MATKTTKAKKATKVETAEIDIQGVVSDLLGKNVTLVKTINTGFVEKEIYAKNSDVILYERHATIYAVTTNETFRVC